MCLDSILQVYAIPHFRITGEKYDVLYKLYQFVSSGFLLAQELLPT